MQKIIQAETVVALERERERERERESYSLEKKENKKYKTKINSLYITIGIINLGFYVF